MVYFDEAIAKCAVLGMRMCSLRQAEALCCESTVPKCTDEDVAQWRRYRRPLACGPRADRGLREPVWTSDGCPLQNQPRCPKWHSGSCREYRLSLGPFKHREPAQDDRKFEVSISS